MAYSILIVEDDNDINNLLKETLSRASYVCTQAYSGTEALLLLKTQHFDLLLLDLMLPGLSGEEVLSELQQITATPVIVLSAKDSLDSKVELLRAGASDYITKPFNVEELLARVEVQLRIHRGENTESEAGVLVYKDLQLDPQALRASIRGHKLELTKQEFKILRLLVERPRQAFSKQAIYDYAWEEPYIGDDKTINVHISNIRKKIRQHTTEEYIETVWGIGFKLKTDS